MFQRALTAQPNDAHIALAKFSLPEYREQIAPGSTFTLITQNVDGLSRRALDHVRTTTGLESTIGSSAMLEMHGRLFDVVCTAYGCGNREEIHDSPICPALRGTESLLEAGSMEPEIDEADLPRCRKCGALARPGVVWFGEIPRHMEDIFALVERADLALVFGTSSTVRLTVRTRKGATDNPV